MKNAYAAYTNTMVLRCSICQETSLYSNSPPCLHWEAVYAARYTVRASLVLTDQYGPALDATARCPHPNFRWTHPHQTLGVCKDCGRKINR